MDTPILVTGGTGTLGRLVVEQLRAAGLDVRVLSRRGGTPEDGVQHMTADLLSGVGLEPAGAGIETIVHCAGARTGDATATRNLVEAAKRAGVRHLVYISVVGADRVPQSGRLDRAMFGYFGNKLATERVVAESGIPWSTLRATQFQATFLLVAQGMARLPLIPVPSGLRFQPVSEVEVAERLVELALGAPAGPVPDLAGPEIASMADLIRAYLHASGKHRLLVPMPVPGRAARAMRDGANLAPERAVGRRTWEEFLEQQLGPESRRAPEPASPQCVP